MPRLGLLLWLFAPGVEGVDTERLLALHLEARGGLAAWSAVRTVKVAGTMSLAGNPPTAFRVFIERPHRYRFEIAVDRETVVHVLDGERGWEIVPTLGRGRPEPMDPDQMRALREQAEDFEGPLVAAASRGGHAIELVGDEEVDGEPTVVLLVRRPGHGTVRTYVAIKSHLEVRREGTSRIEGEEVPYVVDLSDYRRVGEVLVPFRLVRSYGGRGGRQRLLIESIELNVPLESRLFRPPGAPP